MLDLESRFLSGSLLRIDSNFGLFEASVGQRRKGRVRIDVVARFVGKIDSQDVDLKNGFWSRASSPIANNDNDARRAFKLSEFLIVEF